MEALWNKHSVLVPGTTAHGYQYGTAAPKIEDKQANIRTSVPSASKLCAEEKGMV